MTVECRKVDKQSPPAMTGSGVDLPHLKGWITPAWWVWLLLLLGLAAGPVGAASTSATDPRAALLPVPSPVLGRVEEAVRQRLRAAAADLAEVAANPLVTDESLGDAYGELGRLYHAHRLYDSAEACYRNAEVLRPREPRWPYLLGYLYQQAGPRLAEAVTSYRRALALRPDYAPAKLRMALAFLGLNQPEAAEPLLRASLEGAGLEAPAAYGLGKVALTREDYATAIEWLERALRAEPGATRVHYPLAMAYRGAGRLDEARRHLGLRGDVDPAIEDAIVADMEALIGGARARQYHAMKAVWTRRFDVAAREFAAIVELEPDNTDARVSLARALYLLGRQDEAHQALEEALRRDPEHDRANYFLGKLWQERGDEDRAMARFRATLDADPLHAGALFFLADALMRKGQYQQAATHYARVVEIVPEDLRPRQMLAIARITAGRQDAEAKAGLEEALSLFPADPLLTRALARLLATGEAAQVRDGQRALKLARGLYDQTHSIEDAETVAMAYAALEQFDWAVAFQQAAIDAAAGYGGAHLLPGLNTSLDRYRDGQPRRTAWRDDDAVLQPGRMPDELPRR